jgi:hypothetical protein
MPICKITSGISLQISIPASDFIHRACGLWKNLLWINFDSKTYPEPLWTSFHFLTFGCGENFVAALGNFPLFHIKFP